MGHSRFRTRARAPVALRPSLDSVAGEQVRGRIVEDIETDQDQDDRGNPVDVALHDGELRGVPQEVQCVTARTSQNK